jgi:hypothetical protein
MEGAPPQPAAGIVRRDREREHLIGRIQEVVQGLDVAPEVLEHVLPQVGSAAIRHELAQALTAGAPEAGELTSISTEQLSDMAQALEAKTGLNVHDEWAVFGFARALQVASQVVGAVLLPACAYLTIGGLLAYGKPMVASPVISLVLFSVLVVILAVYESLHISVTQLKLADLRALETEFPRAARIQKRFDTSREIERFLAGRQIVVILTVFGIAQLTSHPQEMFPGTSTPTPGWIVEATRLGIPGALMVLWAAQLMPQFIATRRALRIMNQRLIGWAFNVALALEAVGLARPGFWLAAWDKTRESIPPSRAMLWEQAAFATDGFGTIGKTYDVEIDSDSTTIVITSTYLTGLDGLESIPVREIVSKDLRIKGITATTAGRTIPNHLLPVNRNYAMAQGWPSATEVPIVSSDVAYSDFADKRIFSFVLRPRVGAFAAGTLVSARLEVQVEGVVEELRAFVGQPVRFLTTSIEYTNPDDYRHVSLVDVVREYSPAGDGVSITEPVCKVQPEAHDGRLSAGFTVDFPDTTGVYLARWTAR